MIKALRRLSSLTSLDEVSRFAIDIIEAWNNLTRDPLLSRRQIVTTLAAGNNTIAHSLGYAPTGYILTSKSAAITDYLVSKNTNQIVIYSSGAATVTVEVF